MVTGSLANSNIDKINDDYTYDEANHAAIGELTDAQGPLKTAMAFNGILAGLMIGNFVLGAFTLGKPLRDPKSSNVVEYAVDEE